MTPPNNTVAGLAEKWREFARIPPADRSDESITFWDGHSNGLRDCASELEAALASSAPSAGVGCACGNCEVCDGAEAIAAFPAPSAPPSVAGDGGELPALVKQDQVVRVRYYDARGLTCTAYRTGQEIGDSLSRLATAEQPGSAVQGECSHPRQTSDGIFTECDDCGVTIPPPAPALAAAHAAKVAELRKQLAITIDHYNGTPCAEVRWALEREAMIEYADRAVELLRRATMRTSDDELKAQVTAFLSEQAGEREKR